MKIFKLDCEKDAFIVYFFGKKYSIACKSKFCKNMMARKTRNAWEKAERSHLDIKKNDILKSLKEGSICIDCGANVGNIAEVFAETGATVYCFEPNPTAFNALEEKFKNNKNVFLIKKGVSDHSGSAEFYFSEYDDYDPLFFSQSSSIYASKDNVVSAKKTQIELVDLCQFISDLEKPIDILKLDVEGAEFVILKKLINTGLYKNITSILVETHDDGIPEIKEIATEVRQLIKDNNISNIDLSWV